MFVAVDDNNIFGRRDYNSMTNIFPSVALTVTVPVFHCIASHPISIKCTCMVHVVRSWLVTDD